MQFLMYTPCKLQVRSFLYPVITDPVFSKTISDQFAFRPTGSTTAALITLLQHLTDLVSEYGYVHLIALDFSLTVIFYVYCLLFHY